MRYTYGIVGTAAGDPTVAATLPSIVTKNIYVYSNPLENRNKVISKCLCVNTNAGSNFNKIYDYFTDSKVKCKTQEY